VVEALKTVLDVILHLNLHLVEWSQLMGGWLYVVLFLVVFCETGLVVTPFLPGDSLLFAVGSLCALNGSPLQIGLVIPLLIVAAVLGDAVNYAVGRRLGPKVFSREDSWLLNKKHLLRTQEFYERHGGKTIIIARFVPIIRTFAPFVAGVGEMGYRRFAMFNVVGAVAWVVLITPVGYMFAHNEFVQKRFHMVIFAIIGISLVPLAVEFLRGWLKSRGARAS
jgi:membrane-associated protein